MRPVLYEQQGLALLLIHNVSYFGFVTSSADDDLCSKCLVGMTCGVFCFSFYFGAPPAAMRQQAKLFGYYLTRTDTTCGWSV